jgi:hypothetical protein
VSDYRYFAMPRDQDLEWVVAVESALAQLSSRTRGIVRLIFGRDLATSNDSDVSLVLPDLFLP